MLGMISSLTVKISDDGFYPILDIWLIEAATGCVNFGTGGLLFLEGRVDKMADTDDGMGALTTVLRTVVVWGTWDEMFGSAN